MRRAHAHWHDSPGAPDRVDRRRSRRVPAVRRGAAGGRGIRGDRRGRRRRRGDRGGRARAAADRAARRAASRAWTASRLPSGWRRGGIRPWSCSSRAARRRRTARDCRRPPRTGSSRSASSRARRSPRSSADRIDAVAARAPLAGGRSARARRRVGLVRLGRPAPLDPRSGHGLDAHRLRAGRVVAATRQLEPGPCWRRPASAGSSGTSPAEPSISTAGRSSICSSPSPAAGRPRAERSRRSPSDMRRPWSTPVWRSEIVTIVLAVLLVAVCARSYRRAVGPARRARLRGPVGRRRRSGLVLAGGAAARLALPGGDAGDPSLLALEVTLCALAGGLLAALLSRLVGGRRGHRPRRSSSARAEAGRFATSSRGRSPTRPSRSATGFRAGLSSSTPRTARSLFPPGTPSARPRSSRVKRGRSRHSSTTPPCSTTRACARQSRRPRGSPRRTRASPRRCAPRWRSCRSRGGGSSRRGTRSGGAWSSGCAAVRKSGWSGSRSGCARSGWPPPPRPRRIASPGPRLSSSARSRNSSGSRTASIRECSSEAGLAGALSSLAEQAPVTVEVRTPVPRAPGGRRGGRVLRLLGSAREHREARRGVQGLGLGDDAATVGSGSRSRTMVSAAPTRHAERASGVSPTGSRRSEGRSSREPGGSGNAPRGRDPLRRRGAVSAASSVDLRPGLVEALERVARIHRRDGCEVEVALVVHWRR